MPVPPPLSDPSHIETRLLVVAEMLDRAVAEVRRAMDDIKTGIAPPEQPLTGGADAHKPDDEARSTDVH